VNQKGLDIVTAKAVDTTPERLLWLTVNWLTGDRGRYQSSPGKFRAFCRDCGTSLTFEDDELIEFHISTLDSPNDFPPNEHTHCVERIAWLELADSLPRFNGSIE